VNGRYIIFIAVLLISPFHIYSAEWYKRIKADFLMEAGIGYFSSNFNSPVTYYNIINEKVIRVGRLEVDCKAKILDGIDAEFDIISDMNRVGPVIKKGFINFSLTPLYEIRIGAFKKNLGIEEMTGTEDRLTINNSLENLLFDSFGYLGHDFMTELKYKKVTQNNALVTLEAGTGTDGDIRVFGNGAFTYADVWGKLTVSNLYCYHKGFTNSNVFTFGYESPFENLYLCFEGYLGNDPNASDLLLGIGQPNKVYFAGGRVLAAEFFLFNYWLFCGFEPLTEVAYVQHEFGSSKRSLQLTPGINIHLGKRDRVRWMNNLEFLISNNIKNSSFKRQNYKVTSQFQVVW
jgi:hypothetical protein